MNDDKYLNSLIFFSKRLQHLHVKRNCKIIFSNF